MAIQWLIFTPPSTITIVKEVSEKLLLRALVHSNILFKGVCSDFYVESSSNAHTVLSFLAKPLKQHSETLDEDYNVSEDLREFQDWCVYYPCDATYRN
ncbi:hypothetical protein QN277_024025 [Acacia crassicarpa]|uniref:Uncharacterized protein n=1 Tax=Acacia crassicarpa TaxID=499986 RepID=A0AAE1JCT1_9FABA|nr:hypothetical protein QN277_024025 [Acacia crassicarpa]